VHRDFCNSCRYERHRQRRDRHQKVSLSGGVRTDQEVSDQHGEGSEDRDSSAGRQYQHKDQERHDSRGRQVEYPPRNIAHPADRDDGGVNVIGQRHVDIDNVPVGNSAHLHLTGDKVKNCGVADQRPSERAPSQPPSCDGKRQVKECYQPGVG
jgi:hypothetical protein